MGLFNFSQSKNALSETKDLIWMSHQAKLAGCMKLLKELQDVVIIAWFSNTYDEFDQFINQQNGLGIEIQLARSIQTYQVSNKNLVILEHYPIRSKEKDLIENLNPSKVFILSSLDEPLFEQFGSERIIQIMKSLGMKEDEIIEHPMISKSIEQAQKKIEEKVSFEITTNSSKEWFERNISS
jgi:hypothetical protein